MGWSRKTYNSIIDTITCRKYLIQDKYNGQGNLYKVIFHKEEHVANSLGFNYYSATFEFQDSILNKSKKDDILRSLFLERDLYLTCKTVSRFATSFDLPIDSAKEMYHKIKLNCGNLNKLFSKKEIKILANYYTQKQQ